jgi:hypothetical protein
MEIGDDVDASAVPAPENIVETRSGSVLLKHTILKSDHFPGTFTQFHGHVSAGVLK